MHFTYQFQTHEAASEVYFSWETNSPSNIHSNDSSLTSLPSSKMWSPLQLTQKLERASTTPNVAPHSELHYLSWATHNPQRISARITPSHLAFGILNETINKKRLKAIDILYHLLTDRVRQNQFDVYWRPGRENLGDYHTKHHSAQHHKDMCGLILHQANSLQALRGCIELIPLPQPPLRARTDGRTNPSAHRST
jgi:hypothetical protein